MVPYRSSGSARAMMARAMSSAGNRALGRMPYSGAGGRAPAPGPGLTYQAPNSLPFVPYEAAKRMRLGGLGMASPAPPVGAGAGAGATIGATQGASYGAYAGPVGAAIGAVIGAIGGAIAGSINKKDPEQYNFDQAVAIWNQQPDAVYAIGNKYLPLAGLFDLNLKNPHIPIYLKYGHMGEFRFVNDLANLVYNSAQQGKITANDTPITIMSRIVQPWIDSWGYGPMVDPHSDLINRLIIGMIYDYVTGNEQNWNARGGDNPFRLPKFALPQPVAPPPPAAVAAPTPSVAPQIVAPAPSVTYAANGTTLQHDTNASMATPYGIFTSMMNGSYRLQLPGTSSAIDVAYSPQHTGGAGTLQIQWTGNQVVATNSDGSLWAFNPSTRQFVQISAATAVAPASPPVNAAPAPAVPVTIAHDQTGMPLVTLPAIPPMVPPTQAQVPSGFNQVAVDQAGNPIFANAQGVLYAWNGAAMTQFTGQLGSASSQAAQVQAAIQAALAQGYSAAQAAQAAIAQQQAAGAQVPPSIMAQAPAQAAATAAAPQVEAPQTAGIGGALSGSTGLIAVGLTVVGLLFATARPAGNVAKGRRRG